MEAFGGGAFRFLTKKKSNKTKLTKSRWDKEKVQYYHCVLQKKKFLYFRNVNFLSKSSLNLKSLILIHFKIHEGTINIKSIVPYGLIIC